MTKSSQICLCFLILVALVTWLHFAFNPFSPEPPKSNQITLVWPDDAYHSPIMAARTTHSKTSQNITIGFVGDIMQHSSQMHDSFTASYQEVTPLLQSFDIMIGNVEFPVDPTKPIGPPPNSVLFNGSPNHLQALEKAGFDIVSVANNHALDQGERGIAETVKAVQTAGITPCGTAADAPAQDEPIIKTVRGLKIAFYCYTYGVNLHEGENGKLELPSLALPLRMLNFTDWAAEYRKAGLDVLRHHVQAAQTVHADFLIAFVHWGQEWSFSADESQRLAARDFIDSGFDMVVGSHSHVLGEVELYKDKLIAYSLGNFLSGFLQPEVRAGGILELTLQKGEDGLTLESYSFVPTFVDDRHVIRAVSPESAEGSDPLALKSLAIAKRLFGIQVRTNNQPRPHLQSF